MIVATAGHVDHGKTTLIRALTGVDTDRLPEEKERGLTVDLGFAYLPLGDSRTIGFIDVPGHERFVRNMVAGVAGIDLGLLVVAADDGVMPQTREHAAVLRLLGVGRALVALSKADRVGQARIEAVADAIGALLDELGLEKAGLVETAATEGRGVDTLLAALQAEAGALPAPEETGGFRLAVDRSFVVKGAGVVVTGTVHAGRAAVGDRLRLMPGDHEVRIRAIHAQDRPSEVAVRGDRAALNLVGIEREDAVRGCWIVAPGILAPSTRIDGAMVVLESEARPLKHWTPVHVHHGAGRVTGRLAVLEGGTVAPGESGLVQIVTDEPLVAAHGDRIVLRDQSARRTLAGVRVIDPAGPARGRARPERLARLGILDRPGADRVLAGLLEAEGLGFDAPAVLAARNIEPERATALLDRCDVVRFGPSDRRLVIARHHWSDLLARTAAAVAADHRSHPERLGPTLPDLRTALDPVPPPDLVDALVRELVSDGELERRGAVVHRPGHTVALGPDDTAQWQKVSSALVVESGSPPALFPLADALGTTPNALESFLDRMVGCGLAVKIARNRYLTPEQVAEAEDAAARAAGDHPDGFTAAQFRDAAGIGRNLAIDLIEHLDRAGVTQRRGDLRVMRERT